MSKYQKGQTNLAAAKLTALDVLEIRRRRVENRETQGSLARAFGVSVVQIGRILRGEAWQKLGGPIRQTYQEQDMDAALHHLAVARPITKEEIEESQQRLLDMLAQPPKGFTEAEPLDEGRSNELMTRLNSSIKETLK